MKALAAFLAFVSASAFAGGVYYIDPVNGDDTWDGSCPIADRNALDEGARGLKGPRRTLVGADGLTTANQGDIVWLAEGTYTSEVYTDATYGRFRGRVKAGVKLVAAGARDKTIIKGEIDKEQTVAAQKGCGPNAVSCLKMESGCVVQGVTLTDGHVTNCTTENSYFTNGGAVRGSGWLVNCVLTGNVGCRGGATANISAIGCRFYGNYAGSTGVDMFGGGGYNCIFGSGASAGYNVYTGGPFVNCTFHGSGSFGRNFGAGGFVNCIISKADGGNNKNAFLNCLINTTFTEGSTADESNTRVTAAELNLDADGIPLAGSVAIDTGSNSLYDSKFTTVAAVKDFKAVDGLGNPRIIAGTIDVGAVEFDWTKLPSTSGIDLTVLDKTITVKRNFTSPTCCLGFTFDGEKVLFPDDDEAYVWTKTVEDEVTDHSLKLIYSNSWFVDAVNGDDDNNDGYTAKRAKRTLAGAMAIPGLKSGHVVHAAPGVYNEGVMAPQDTVCYCSNRVVIASGVGLVADQGPTVTVIEGFKSKANANGTGPDAIRCVYGKSNTAYVRGFTLRNGSTPVKESQWDATAGGGAVYGATALDCVITNNYCGYRGGAGFTVRFIRCRITGNGCADGTGTDCYSCDCYGCVLSGGFVLGNYYNCTVYGQSPWGSGTVKIYNSVLEQNLSVSSGNVFDLRNVLSCGTFGGVAGTTTNEFCRFNVPAAQVARDAATLRPLFGSMLIDAGSDALWTDNFPAAFAAMRDLDFAGGPRQIGTIDVGAGEYDWRTLPSSSGLDLSLTDNGDGTTTLSVSRNFTGERLCLGFTYGDETVMFDDHEKGYVWTKTLPLADILKSTLAPVYPEVQKDFYVDCENGDDSNRGYHPDCAWRTLVGAMTNASVKSGCVVHAAPGVYNEGTMWGDDCSNRVVIAAGVGLVADGGAAVTTIEGAAATGPDATAKGNGSDAVRCVYLGGTAWIRGFTITGGHTQSSAGTVSGRCAGGVRSAAQGVVVECDITGNSADYRGPAAFGGVYIRCRFHGNGGRGGDYPVYLTDAMVDCAAYTTGEFVYGNPIILNCAFTGGNTWGTEPKPVYNSYISSDDGNKAYTNCVLGVAKSKLKSTSTADDATCRFEVAASFDGNRRPLAGSPLIDTADKALYDRVFASILPKATVAMFREPLDVGLGQRIYNGKLDIGAGEYDWRGDFAKELRMRGVEVEAASANVTTNAVKGVDLADGETLKFKGSLKVSGTVSFKVAVTGGGTVTAKLGEAVLVPDVSGVYSFQAEAGETDIVTVSFAGSGTATVSDVVLPLRGMLMLVR